MHTKSSNRCFYRNRLKTIWIDLACLKSLSIKIRECLSGIAMKMKSCRKIRFSWHLKASFWPKCNTSILTDIISNFCTKLIHGLKTTGKICMKKCKRAKSQPLFGEKRASIQFNSESDQTLRTSTSPRSKTSTKSFQSKNLKSCSTVRLRSEYWTISDA